MVFTGLQQRGDAICCTVEGGRHCSNDLIQGGMEIPFQLTFKGPSQELQKVQKYFISAKKSRVLIVNTSSDSLFNKCVAKFVADFSPATYILTNPKSLTPHDQKSMHGSYF